MRSTWLAAALVASSATAAAPALKPPEICQLEGVTKDGRSLVWGGGADEMGPDPRLVIQDLISGNQLVLSDEAAEKWRKTHPLLNLVSGRNSPDKSRTLGIELGPAVVGSWVGSVWSSDGGEWKFLVTHDGKATPVATTSVASAIGVYWTPDGKHTVFVAHHSGQGMRDPGYDELVIGTDGNPAVGLAVEKPKLKDAEKVAGPLGKGGFTVVSITPAQQPREKSVVYAATGSEADAARLAALVPGGATVEKMTWKSALPLVVALGPAALK